jgi:hypothetical protein
VTEDLLKAVLEGIAYGHAFSFPRPTLPLSRAAGAASRSEGWLAASCQVNEILRINPRLFQDMGQG